MTESTYPPAAAPWLIEMLVAMTASLILFGAVVTILQILGDAVSKSRRTGRLDSDMCSVRTRLQLDLAGVTANRDPSTGLKVEVDSGSVSGYFEVIEGPRSDTQDAGGTAIPAINLVADIDDVLLFTTRNTETPYLGRYTSNPASPGTTQTTESQLAEVAWFLRPTDVPAGTSPAVTTYTLFRRQNLVIGYVGVAPFLANSNQAFWSDYNSWANFFELAN
jgi:hypothetical protein